MQHASAVAVEPCPDMADPTRCALGDALGAALPHIFRVGATFAIWCKISANEDLVPSHPVSKVVLFEEKNQPLFMVPPHPFILRDIKVFGCIKNKRISE
jgi:hypothetical protein